LDLARLGPLATWISGCLALAWFYMLLHASGFAFCVLILHGDDSLQLVRLRSEKLEGLYARCDGARAMGYRSLTSTFTLTARHSQSTALVVN
jgi:hypothetical protein